MIKKAALQKRIEELESMICELKRHVYEQSFYQYVSNNGSLYSALTQRIPFDITYRQAIDAICEHLGVTFDSTPATSQKIVLKLKEEAK